MARDILKAKLDIIFKKLFTDDGDNEIMLIKMFRLKSSYKYDENIFLD